MTLQTFYRRLRREDPARWMVEETGHIRRDDGHCPVEAVFGHPFGGDAQLGREVNDRVMAAADNLRHDGRLNRPMRAALLRNLGITEEGE